MGETIGLEREHVHDDEIHVEWQLREIRSTFHRLPPKDDSYRSPNWEPCLPVNLPPFLADLLARQIQAQPRPGCLCAEQHGGIGHYCSSARTAATPGAATTPTACSAWRATAGTSRTQQASAAHRRGNAKPRRPSDHYLGDSEQLVANGRAVGARPITEDIPVRSWLRSETA